MKISRLILLSVSFILLLFSITTYINFNQSKKVRENDAFFALSSNYVRQINLVQRNILNMERSLRGFLLTGENYLLQSYNTAKTENDNTLHELIKSNAANTDQYNRLTDLSTLYTQWVNKFAEPLRNARLKSDSSSLSTSSFEKMYMDDLVKRREDSINRQLQKNFTELREAEYIHRESKRKILEHSEKQTKTISFSLTALSIITGFVIAFMLARHISGRIMRMVNMADSIAGGNYQVQVDDKANDELSNLSNSLNNMADILDEHITLLKRKNQELDQFAHIVSHDLKAPLRGIDNVVTWIEEDHNSNLPPKVQEYLQLIRSRITRLENLVQGILTYARIGKETQAMEEVDVKALVEEIMDNIPPRPGITIDISSELPVLQTDKVPLLQILSNLIDNAIKYHDKSPGLIRIYSKEFPQHFEFFIEDNGPGIAAAYHEKIFVIFQTLQELDSFQSTGVGLAIVKKILVDRKETITIKSEPGKGSIFSFTWAKN